MTLILLGLLALALLLILAFKPDWLAALVLFIIYTNAAVVGYKYHGIPYVAAASVTLLLMLPMAYYVVIQRRPIRWNPVLIPLYLLLCAQLLSTLFAPFPDRSYPAVLDFAVEGLALYFLVTNALRDEDTLRKGIWALLAAGAFMGGLVLFQAQTNTLNNDYWGFAQSGGLFESSTGSSELRHAGPIGEQNNFALILLALIPMGWFMMYYAKTGVARWAAAGATALIAMGVMLTYSRAAGVVMVAMIPVMALITRTKFIYLVVGGAAGLALVFAMAPDFVARIASLEELQELFQGDTLAVNDRSLRGRASENLTAISMFYDHPLVGVGETNYSPLYEQYSREFSLDTRSDRRPHNLFLGVLAEGGLIGFAALMSVFAAALAQLWMARSRALAAGHTATAALCALLMVSIVARLVNGIFLDLTYERYLWLLMGVAGSAAMLRIPERRSSIAERLSIPSADTIRTAQPYRSRPDAYPTPSDMP